MKRKYIIALIGLVVFFNMNFSKYASASSIPLPDSHSNYTMRYNQQDNKMTLSYSSSLESASYTYTFSHYDPPAGVQPTTESISVINPTGVTWDGRMPGIIRDDAFIAFKLDDVDKNVFMLVNTRTGKCVGLWTKNSDDYTWNWLRVIANRRNNPNVFELFAYHNPANLPDIAKTATNGSISSTKLEWDDDLISLALNINGYFYTETSGTAGEVGQQSTYYYHNNIGYHTEVFNLYPDDSISDDIKLCGKIYVDFNGSEFYENIPEEIKNNFKPVDGKENIYEWPSDTAWNSSVKLYLLYEHGGSWTRATFGNTGGIWAIERRLDQIDISEDGSFSTNSLQGFPVGKYKVTGLAYLRRTSDSVRFDGPNSGFISDFLANLRGDKDSIENFQFEPFEVDISSGDLPEGQEGVEPNCIELMMHSRGLSDAGGSYSDSNNESDSLCKISGVGGYSMGALIFEAFCNMVVGFKLAVDSLFKKSLNFMMSLIGVTDSGRRTSTAPSDAGQVPAGPNTGPTGSEETGENTNQILEMMAKSECNGKKSGFTAEQWEKGPCIGYIKFTENDLVYKLDVAHNPRQAVDNNPSNQCENAVNFVELDTDCNILRIVTNEGS